MKLRVGKDEITPAFELLLRNIKPEKRKRILSEVANDLRNTSKKNIEAEKQYDGKKMKSPAKKTKFGGRFAQSYNYRYREGFRHLDSSEKKQFRVQGKVGGGGGRQLKKHGKTVKVRRRIPVTPQSKQLQDTGDTIKSIDILSVNCNRAAVGPKTGHGQAILGFHEKMRRPFGISKAFAKKAQKYAFKKLLEGVG